MSFVHGFHPVRESLRRRPHQVQRVLIARRAVRGAKDAGAEGVVLTTPGASGPRVREIAELAARHGVRVEVVEWSVLRRLAPEARQGVVAELAQGEDVAAPPSAAVRPGGDPGLVVLLEDIQDPRNLGALLRVCEGAGVGRVLIRDRGAAPLTPTVAAASAGATEWLDVERVTNTVAELERLKEAGFWVYGAAEGGVAPWELDLTGPTAICFGGEEKGLRRLTRERCDRLIGLPMRGRVESLNVATAAAALLYEAVRQRTPPPTGRPGVG